jgi:hypothetical protein
MPQSTNLLWFKQANEPATSPRSPVRRIKLPVPMLSERFGNSRRNVRIRQRTKIGVGSRDFGRKSLSSFRRTVIACFHSSVKAIPRGIEHIHLLPI